MKYICTENCNLLGLMETEHNWCVTSTKGSRHFRPDSVFLSSGDVVEIIKMFDDFCCKQDERIFNYELTTINEDCRKRIFIDESTLNKFFREPVLDHFEIKQFDNILTMNNFLKKYSADVIKEVNTDNRTIVYLVKGDRL